MNMTAEALPAESLPAEGFRPREFWVSAARQAIGAIGFNIGLRGVMETGAWLALEPTRPDSTQALGAHLWGVTAEGVDSALPTTIASVASGTLVLERLDCFGMYAHVILRYNKSD